MNEAWRNKTNANPRKPAHAYRSDRFEKTDRARKRIAWYRTSFSRYLKNIVLAGMPVLRFLGEKRQYSPRPLLGKRIKTSFNRWPKAATLLFVVMAWSGAAGLCAGAEGIPETVAATVAGPPVCKKIELNGEVSAGHEWKTAFGEGWVFRVLPIPEDKTAPGVGGWDLIVDGTRPAGFPDALMLASPPYHFISQREIATTFGLRAQDAIGWNPRKFRFMTSRSEFREAHKLYLELNRNGAFTAKADGDGNSRKDKARKRRMDRFLKLTKDSSPGVFRILDAKLTPGNGTVKPYAINWAQQSASTPHTDEPPPGGKITPLGKLQWVRFSVTLWLPQGWHTPHGLQVEQAACPD